VNWVRGHEGVAVWASIKQAPHRMFSSIVPVKQQRVKLSPYACENECIVWAALDPTNDIAKAANLGRNAC
jgi:hypothetical protein